MKNMKTKDFKSELTKERLVRQIGSIGVYNINKHMAPKTYEEIRQISSKQFGIVNSYDRFDETKNTNE